MIQIGREAQFELFVNLIGRPEWLDDERFATRAGWLTYLDAIRAAVRNWAGSRGAVEVCDALAAAGVAAAPCFEAENVVTDPHVGVAPHDRGVPSPRRWS